MKRCGISKSTNDGFSGQFKKAKVVTNKTMINLLKMNPSSIGFYAVKEHKEMAGYTFNLTKVINDEKYWAQVLKICSIVDKKVFNTNEQPLLSKGYNWKMYIRALKDHKIYNVD